MLAVSLCSSALPVAADPKAPSIETAAASLRHCNSFTLEWGIRSIMRESTKRRARRLEGMHALSRSFAQIACDMQIDPALLLAVAERESHFNRGARGPRGALGLLQVKPSTAAAIANQRGWGWFGDESLYEPEINLRFGVAYLIEMQQRFGSWEAALSAYNMGPSRLRKRMAAGSAASSDYARSILERRVIFARALERAGAPAIWPSGEDAR